MNIVQNVGHDQNMMQNLQTWPIYFTKQNSVISRSRMLLEKVDGG